MRIILKLNTNAWKKQGLVSGFNKHGVYVIFLKKEKVL
jgi:hypothetical protein